MGAETGPIYDSRWYLSPLDDAKIFASEDFSVKREAYRALKPLIARIRSDMDQLEDHLEGQGELHTPGGSDEEEEEVEEPEVPYNPFARK
jgi:hypothetical protein